MWTNYRKTFLRTQLVILMLLLAVYQAAAHQWTVVATIFVAMQMGAVAGAAWANRLTNKITRGSR